ncbi:hypothetical protein TYRP_022493 [Tyrophagus putrescentiae]|nr:hypothetical protein TYRP_022896 [Tyrophagus putrescentiae]KAH9391786.1 hypothetical protein TYRP_022493 [Tyrophagus putrescentiae]
MQVGRQALVAAVPMNPSWVNINGTTTRHNKQCPRASETEAAGHYHSQASISQPEEMAVWRTLIWGWNIFRLNSSSRANAATSPAAGAAKKSKGWAPMEMVPPLHAANGFVPAINSVFHHTNTTFRISSSSRIFCRGAVSILTRRADSAQGQAQQQACSSLDSRRGRAAIRSIQQRHDSASGQHSLHRQNSANEQEYEEEEERLDFLNDAPRHCCWAS